MTLLEKEWFIQAPWGRISIVAWGDCRDPPVLVCHGAKDSAASFRPLIRLLPMKFYYIGVELPGNGKSDPLPPGLMVSLYDLVYTIQVVVKHFRWEQFVFMGHSMGCSVGYTYGMSYPGKISKLILLDPISLGFAVPVEKYKLWYETYIKKYFDNYDRFNRSIEDKPKYTRDEAIAKLMKRRGFSVETAEETLARVTQRTADGLVRFTFDERSSMPTYPPFAAEHLKKLFTGIRVPILTVVAEASVSFGRYESAAFLFDDAQFPANNHRLRRVAGAHDLQANHAGAVAPLVAPFLLHGVQGLDGRAKL